MREIGPCGIDTMCSTHDTKGKFYKQSSVTSESILGPEYVIVSYEM